MSNDHNPVMLTVEEAKSIMDALQEAGVQLQRFAALDDEDSARDIWQVYDAETRVAGAYGMIEDALQASGN